jgi:hypothetical protein
MNRIATGLVSTVLVLLSYPVSAVTIRYALIVGNNEGTDTDGSRPFVPLLHAEREATLLREKLVRYANFDPSGNRTRLLRGATRKEVRAAMADLVRKKRSDQNAFGKIDTLFMFYFTGHGLNGRLLLKDGAILAEEVAWMFSEIDADFSIGVFDACFAGSLDATVLASKGIHSAPGLNLFRELPEDVLSAEGRIWYVSSGSNQESYEDDELGGVFTHFFIEALEKAESSGPGITLENIWQYARAHTVEYTAERRRIQTPEQLIANLRSNAPIYFSFLSSRSSTLVLSKALEGRFALAYEQGSLTEVFEKQEGAERVLAVYPGVARLILVDGEDRVSSRRITLQPGEKIVLSALEDAPPFPALGESSETLLEKGVMLDTMVSARHFKRGTSFLMGFGYGFSVAHAHLLFARHGFFFPLRFDFGRLFFGANIIYGYDKRTYPAWYHRVHEFGGKVYSGTAVTQSGIRLGIGAALDAAYLIQSYDDELLRDGWLIRPLVEVNLLCAWNKRLHGALSIDIGGAYEPGIGARAENIWAVYATFGAALHFRVF